MLTPLLSREAWDLLMSDPSNEYDLLQLEVSAPRIAPPSTLNPQLSSLTEDIHFPSLPPSPQRHSAGERESRQAISANTASSLPLQEDQIGETIVTSTQTLSPTPLSVTEEKCSRQEPRAYLSTLLQSLRHDLNSLKDSEYDSPRGFMYLEHKPTLTES